MKTSNLGIKLIEYFEGLHDGDLTQIGLQPKLCPAGVWTVGYGHALTDYEGNLLRSNTSIERVRKIYPELSDITEQMAEELLREDLIFYEGIVSSKLKREVKQHEFDAIVSHTYNTGGSETLFKLINTNAPEIEIKQWWTKKYISSAGKILNGLIKRRRSEWILYNTGELIT